VDRRGIEPKRDSQSLKFLRVTIYGDVREGYLIKSERA